MPVPPQQAATQFGVADALNRQLDATQGAMLAQVAPSTTGTTLLYQPPEGTFAHVFCVIMTNTGAGTPDVTLYHDDGGGTYTANETIYHKVALATGGGNECFPSSPSPYAIQLNGVGSLGCKTSIADEVTFTVYGKEFPL